MAALSVVDFLAAHSIKAKIKWPNDIYVNDRKICGMLIENSLQAGRIAWSIVGIGINVNQTEFSRDTGNPTSMALETARDSTSAPEELDIREALQEFMDIFKGYTNRYLHISGGLGKLHLLYLAHKRIPPIPRLPGHTYRTPRRADGHSDRNRRLSKDFPRKNNRSLRCRATRCGRGRWNNLRIRIQGNRLHPVIAVLNQKSIFARFSERKTRIFCLTKTIIS